MTQFFETTHGILVLGAMIGAGCFAAGTIIPNAFRWASAERFRKSKGDTRGAAMLTVLALDDFVGASYAAVHDTPEFNPINDGEFAFHVPDPTLVLPSGQDLSVLGEELLEEILWLSNRVTNLSNALDVLDLSRPGFDGFFERREEGYAVLGAKAMDLIERLLAEFDVRLPDKPDYYRQREGFAAILQNAGERQLRRKKLTPKVEPEPGGSNITQLFPKTGGDAD